MPDGDGNEPVTEDETLYRRIPVSQGWYDPQTGRPNRIAFSPHAYDVTGLSLVRAKYKTPEQAALSSSGKPYYVAVLSAKDLFDNGLNVVAKPEPGNPAHAEIPDIRYDNRKAQSVREAAIALAERITKQVLGPYPPLTEPKEGLSTANS